ncbi:transcriptional regulator, MarR family [Cupriavidus sp. OV038]|jgi:DNA-binding MarR family transcriptional regulator|uniref:MarR family winged helix-turn-helix transcriptional regulator n=1 Tax=unclassified Cupriavidus TaxID=2640874 RepID=UPI0008E50D0E|nr:MULTISPECIES: MarR family transcriptional regulator [unclassified Cupriavidus]SFD27636.1 transcriptional regulator, MarR family [Cupriavidus sp. OV038]SFP97204.1 transcriptional regulator, MarR family [Cupriavidus sp. OV096]
MAKTTAQVGASAAEASRLPAPGEGKRGESGYLAYLLRQASAANRLRMERALDDLGVTVPQFFVLTMLGAYPGISGADVARLALLTPQTVSVIMNNLEKVGAIARTPHPVHGRIQTIALTEAGRTLLAGCKARATKVDEDLRAGLTSEEEQVVRRWLVSLASPEEGLTA